MVWRICDFERPAAAVLARLRLLALFSIITALSACGGSGSAMPTAGGIGTGGTANAARVSVGTITGFGSVHLNGLKFQTTSARITVDGKAATQSDLHVGEMIEVKGHHDDAADQDIADEIDFRGTLEGPVSAVDATAHTITVLAQTVRITSDTSFGDDISPASIAGIHAGAFVEVSGFTATDGTVQATRVAGRAPTDGLQIIGTVSSVDAPAKTLSIGALTVSFSAAALKDFPSAGPQQGDLVEATGASLDAQGTLIAAQLELRTDKEMRGEANARSEIEGLITRFASASDFDLSGRPVSSSSATTFVNGSAADLALNVRIEAEGTLDASGVLAAARIRIEHEADVRIIAQVDSVDAAAGTVVALGIQIGTDMMTRFEDQGPQKVNTFSLADIRTGDWLEIRGSVTTSAGAAVLATRIDRVSTQSRVELAGKVTAVAQPDFTLLTTTVATSGSTQFDHGLSQGGFFDTALDRTVRVRGSWNGAVLAAQEVSIDDDGED